jgi:hypothetical protein
MLLVWVLFLAIGCSAQPTSHSHGSAGGATPATTPPLFDNLGRHHRAISTTSPQAQAYFDQGLRLVYGFNHYEAQAAFREAARLDPACAMCAWGIALTYGANYNSPTDADRERGALAAMTQARTLAAARGTDRERALIDALAARHSSSPGADRAALDRAYADAMREVARRFPADLDAGTLFADALMNLRPWSLWTPEGKPQPGTEEIVTTLERVLAADPHASGRQSPLHPRGGGEPGSAARRSGGGPAPASDAGGGAHGPHALAHLLPGRTLRGRRVGERAGGDGRPRLLREEPAQPDLPDDVPPAQPRLRLARGLHGRPRRRVRAGGA